MFLAIFTIPKNPSGLGILLVKPDWFLTVRLYNLLEWLRVANLRVREKRLKLNSLLWMHILVFARVLWEQRLWFLITACTCWLTVSDPVNRSIIAILNAFLYHIDDLTFILRQVRWVIPEVVDVFMADDTISRSGDLLGLIWWVHPRELGLFQFLKLISYDLLFSTPQNVRCTHDLLVELVVYHLGLAKFALRLFFGGGFWSCDLYSPVGCWFEGRLHFGGLHDFAFDRVGHFTDLWFQVLQVVEMSLAAADTYCDVLVLRARGTTGPDRTYLLIVLTCALATSIGHGLTIWYWMRIGRLILSVVFATLGWLLHCLCTIFGLFLRHLLIVFVVHHLYFS